jgi:hypothetical protein
MMILSKKKELNIKTQKYQLNMHTRYGQSIQSTYKRSTKAKEHDENIEKYNND